MSKVWFVTGSSRGFGRQFVEAALSRGDRVAATARNTDSLTDLVTKYGPAILPLALDVTDKAAATEAVSRAHEHFGRLDVVVNNAGYGLFGTVEELSEQDIRTSSRPTCSGPCGSPRRRCRTCAPRAAATSSRSPPSAESPPCPPSADTALPSGRWKVSPKPWPGKSPHSASMSPSSSPASTPPTGAAPPLRVFFGTYPLPLIRQTYVQRLKTWSEWAELSAEAECAQV
jgi:short chain dehydrogenase